MSRTFDLTEPTSAEIADAEDLRSVIVNALVATPLDDLALRRGVWTYVSMARHAGAAPGRVIMALTELVEEANLEPRSANQALMRRVIMWCVEAYFGHLGGEVTVHDGHATSELAVPVSSR